MLMVRHNTNKIREFGSPRPRKLFSSAQNEEWPNDAPQVGNKQKILEKGDIDMGILKTIGKVTGTAVLSATWLASGILKKASDTAGFELGSELFGAGNDASANGIKRLWNKQDSEPSSASEGDEEIALLKEERHKKRVAAANIREMAIAAQKAGNDEKYNSLMGRYNDLMAEVSLYDEEILKAHQESI